MWRQSTTFIPLQIFNLYRLFVATAFLLAYLLKLHPIFLGHLAPTYFGTILFTYWVFATLVGLRKLQTDRKVRSTQNFIIVSLLIDLSFLFIIMHLSGGVITGLGILFLVVIAAAAVLFRGPWTYFFAALSTLLLLGEQVWIAYTQPYIDTAFTQAAILGTVYLVFARVVHLISNRLRRSEATMASLIAFNQRMLNTVHTGVLLLDRRGRIEVCNNAAREMLPLEALQLPEYLKHEFRSANEGKFTLTAFSLGVYCLPIEDKKIFVLIDEGVEVKRSQEKRLAALGQMASSIAHEIRNPLSSISHAAQLMQEEGTYQEDLTSIIVQNCTRLNHVIENVLSLTRKQPAVLEKTDLHAWLTSWVYTLTPEQKKLTLSGKSDPANVDVHKLRQVLSNLIENAFQAPDVSQVSVVISQSKHTIEISVIDNGHGIASEAVEDLFDPFFTTRPTGTGLGLSIARALCEAQGLELYYLEKSKPGATFQVVIPLDEAII